MPEYHKWMHALQASLLESPSVSNLNNSNYTIFSVLSFSIKKSENKKNTADAT